MLFSVYEEPGDAGVVAIGYCRSRLIMRYFWLGGLDSRSAVRQVIFMCVVSCAENIGAHHTQYDQSWFFLSSCVGALQIKHFLRFIKSLCVYPPLVMFNTTNFLSDPILSKIQAGIGDTDPMLCANTPNVSGKSKKSSLNDQFLRKHGLNKSRLFYLCEIISVIDITSSWSHAGICRSMYLFCYLFLKHIY